MNQHTRGKSEEELFSTHDLALSSSLLSLGFTLCDLDFTDPKKATFIFVENEEVQLAIQDYWDGKLRVNPRTYFNTLKDLKSRLYTHKY